MFQCDDAFAVEKACNDALEIAATKNGGLRPSPAPFRDRTHPSGVARGSLNSDLGALLPARLEPTEIAPDYHTNSRAHCSDTAMAWLKTLFRLADLRADGVLESQHVRVLLLLLGITGQQVKVIHEDNHMVEKKYWYWAPIEKRNHMGDQDIVMFLYCMTSARAAHAEHGPGGYGGGAAASLPPGNGVCCDTERNPVERVGKRDRCPRARAVQFR